MQASPRLVDDRVHHLGMGVSGRVDRNARRTVEEVVAVHASTTAPDPPAMTRDSCMCMTATRPLVR
jgi:hypothetical protein